MLNKTVWKRNCALYASNKAARRLFKNFSHEPQWASPACPAAVSFLLLLLLPARLAPAFPAPGATAVHAEICVANAALWVLWINKKIQNPEVFILMGHTRMKHVFVHCSQIFYKAGIICKITLLVQYHTIILTYHLKCTHLQAHWLGISFWVCPNSRLVCGQTANNAGPSPKGLPEVFC